MELKYKVPDLIDVGILQQRFYINLIYILKLK